LEVVLVSECPSEAAGFQRNVEIKACIDDWSALVERVEALAGPRKDRLHQRDTFYHATRGRLKLRQLGPEVGQLIFYERPDETTAKTSHYLLFETESPEALGRLLVAALGERAVVVKERHLFLLGETRIHLDRVEGLGEFLELEVVLGPEDSEDVGREIAQGILESLGIEEERLIDCAYVDLLEALHHRTVSAEDELE
jgi:predicted adenylyl cyclase CyaB